MDPIDIDAIERLALANAGGPADTAAMRALIRAVRERDAEIARLTVENEWNGSVANDMQERAIAAQEEVAQLSAPPGADVMERGAALFLHLLRHSRVIDYLDDQRIGERKLDASRALQQYGDERAAAAREAAIEWRHKKHGNIYVERDRGELQLATDHVLKEGDRLVSYRGTDGQAWFRYEPEFEDGRFEMAAKPGSKP